MKNNWKDGLTDRQLKEIEFARIYTRDFSHGTSGHNALVLIAMLADKLDSAYETDDNQSTED